jgi:ABC-2 type transport system ATP-binding protein
MAAVEVSGLSKRYGPRGGSIQALSDLSFAIPRGGIFGLLGPNGAGKSTLMRIVAGLVFADEGEVRLFGEPASVASRSRLGAFIESATFYPFLTASEVLEVLARTSGRAVAAGPLLSRVGLASAADRRVRHFSLGMKQRLGIAAALIGGPDLLLLDEPANGLDPPGTLELRETLRSLADEEGITVIMSSHLLDEVERLCDRVAVLDHGRLRAEGDLASLLAGEEKLWLDAAPIHSVLARLSGRGRIHAGGVAVAISRAETPALLKALSDEGIAIYEARWLRSGLERFFQAEKSQ